MTIDQSAICEKYGSIRIEPSADEVVGLATHTLDMSPLYGVRILPTQGACGWYIWGGPHSTDPDFFKATHVSHLERLCPHVLKYLCLEPGFKFIVDRAGFEDVWREALA